MTRRLGVTIVSGVLFGAAYTASPLTVAFAIALPMICWIVMRDVPPSERRRIAAVLALSIAIRLLAIGGLFVLTDPAREQFAAFFPDAHYAIQRSWWIRNLWLGVPIGPHGLFGIFDPYGSSSYAYFLAVVQTLVGPSPYGVDLISVASIVAAALVLFRIVRRAYGSFVALTVLAIVLWWPTTVAWSISALREAPQLLLVTIALAAAVAAVRASTAVGRIAAVVLLIADVYAVGTMRAGALMIIALGVGAALVVRAATLRPALRLAAVCVPVALGVVLLLRADARAFVEYQADLAANRHLGQVSSSGRGYRLLDGRFYREGPQSTFTMTPSEAARFFARAAVAFVVVPLPWRATSRSEMAIVPQQLAWYAIVALACLGLREAWRRDGLVTALFVCYALVGLAVIAPNSGNIGTLVRHRDTIVPALVCLAGVGIDVVSRNRASGSSAVATAQRSSIGVNPVDAGVVLALALTIVLAAAMARIFRHTTPAFDVIAPTTLTAHDRQLSVQGRDLTAYLRVFVAPAGEPLILSDPINHGREAIWHARTAVDGELDVPATIPAHGAYDLYVYDDARQVGFVSGAFRFAQ